MEMIGKLFSDNLKRLRERDKLTQEALSERLGVSIVTIQNYENRRRWPDPDVMDKLCGIFDVRPSAFFLAKGEIPKPDPEEALAVLSEALRKPRESREEDELVEWVKSLSDEERRDLENFREAMAGESGAIERKKERR